LHDALIAEFAIVKSAGKDNVVCHFESSFRGCEALNYTD
jgi:hypothetical protein